MEGASASCRRLAVIHNHCKTSPALLSAVNTSQNEEGIFVILPEVAKALASGEAVVALESTIVSHGMPYPQNLETAKEVEAVVRKAGAVPATIALLDGRIHVGLDEQQLTQLAVTGEKASKASRRDIASVLSRGAVGSTTVSATSWIAVKAGISVFATGGIGGVHRGAEQTFDVSADLTELGRTDIAVVCAGAKSLLDIPKTLEYLETQGVAVVGYKTNEFPAFFTPHSGQKTPLRVDSAEEAARLIYKNKLLGHGSGIVIAVPINPKDAADAGQVEAAIQKSLLEASTKGITGRDITPFLLQRINELTSGQSLKSNIALIKQNALVAAQIACQLSQTKRQHGKCGLTTSSTASRVTIIGGAALDISSSVPVGNPLVAATSNPGRISLLPGGVGRNITECLCRLGETPFFISALGDDAAGQILLSNLHSLNAPTQGVEICKGVSTAIYSAFLSSEGELQHAISDMRIILSHVTVPLVRRHEQALARSKFVIVDGNVARDVLLTAASLASHNGVPVWFEPVSVAKCVIGADAAILPLLTYVSPNVLELHAMADAARGKPMKEDITEGNMKKIMEDATELINKGVAHVIVTMGASGVLLATRVAGSEKVAFHHLRPGTLAHVRGVTGAGDSLVGATVWGLLQGKDLLHALACGMNAGRLSVESEAAVSPLISQASLANSSLHELSSFLVH